jgi:Polyketide cyclase / dehydrase and lipid transport
LAKTVRSGPVSATPQEIWAVVANPYHLQRWWPGVTRVENVRDGHFTEVIPTKRGKPVRLDFTIVESVEFERRCWSQELFGTPFERLLNSWTTTIEIAPDGDQGSTVTITDHQQLRGSFRLGGILQTRPARRRVATALENLTSLFG